MEPPPACRAAGGSRLGRCGRIPLTSSGSAPAPGPWEYDAGENPKRKHGWKQPVAGFLMIDGRKIGKCPKGFASDLARRLLNDGISVRGPKDRHSWPREFWVIHDGVPYRALPTRRGRSYHGFPACGADFRELPGTVQEALKARARELGCHTEVKRWLERH
jgi:hypothetical protein